MVETLQDGEMSRQTFEVAYAGGSPDDHSMDVQDLAPALVAIGQLVREANATINGDKSTVKVLVVSDFEHKCFNINFEVVQTFWEQVQTFLIHDDVRSAKELLEWIGLLTGTGVGSWTVWQFYKHLKGRKIESTELIDDQKSGTISIKIVGDHNPIVIDQKVYALSQNPKIANAIKGTLAPLGTDNINRIQFRNDGITTETNETDATDIIASCETVVGGTAVVGSTAPDTVTAYLKVYSPVFDQNAEKWRFVYNDHNIYADISGTDIAIRAIERGSVKVNDVYKVKLEIVQVLQPGNKIKYTYKVLEVLDFIPAPQQNILPLHPPETGNDDGQV